MKKRLLATFLSMAMVAGLATGCSTPGSGKDGGASDGEKVFRYATNTLPTTLDPNKGQGMVDNEIQHAITEGLVRIQVVIFSQVLQKAGIFQMMD